MTSPIIPGEDALHGAARSGNIELVRLLLQRCHDNPNAADDSGRTPLYATCLDKNASADVVRLLLQAGGDPALREEHGINPLHLVAHQGRMDLLDMLYSIAPTALNVYTDRGETPLYLACERGHEKMVRKLLLLGAMERKSPGGIDTCPLLAAVHGGFVGVVRLLISKEGIKAVAGPETVPSVMHCVIQYRQAVVLRLLLKVSGEAGRTDWANLNFFGTRLVHFAAGFCYPAAVSVLLEAGADEGVRDLMGRTPRESFRLCPPWNNSRDRNPHPMCPSEEVAICRMLDRGPAYQARSWAWPLDQKADASNSRYTPAAAATADGTLSPSVSNPSPNVRVRIFRPKENNCSRKFLGRLICGYCAKD